MSDSKSVALPEKAPVDDLAVQTPERRRNYNRLVRQANLVSIFLEELKFKAAPETLSIPKDKLRRSIQAKMGDLLFNEEEGVCMAKVGWGIEIKNERRKLVQCTATYVLIYDNIRNCPEETVRTFVEHIGKAACYAYFRAMYAQVDWAAGIGSPPIPVMRLEPKL